MSSLRIANMIIGLRLNHPIDINRDPKYNSKKFSGLIRKNCYGTLLVFKSGNINVTGVKSMKQAKLAVTREYPHSEQHGHKIINMTFHTRLPFSLSVNSLFESKDKRLSYHPELFPGIHWRQPKSKLVILFFHTGKVIITGVQCRMHASAAYKSFLEEVSKHKKGREGDGAYIKGQDPIENSHLHDGVDNA